MNSFSYARRSFLRAGWRNAAYLLGLALAVALFSSTLFFVDGSTRAMTQRALAPVLLDFQARAIDPKTDITQFASQLRNQPGVRQVLPFASASASVPQPGNASAKPLLVRLFALPPDYASAFPLLHVTSGQFPSDGALVSDQLAVGLGLKPGDTLQLTVPGLNLPYSVTITGTLNTDQADPLFAGPSAAPEGSYNVAAAVVAIDYARFQRDLSGPLQVAVNDPAQGAAPLSAASAIGIPLLLDRQLHIRIDRSALPSDPSAAMTQVGVLRSTLERQASGQIKITDNLTSTLTGAIHDVVSARLLFIFLGLPGVLLAAYLARYAASLVTEAQRRDIALLRSRGLASREILAIMSWTAFFTATAGVLTGLALGALGTAAIFGASTILDGGAVARSVVFSIVLGLALGGLGVFLPARRMLAGEISDERRSVQVRVRPLWLRLPLDVGLLAAAALALWFSGSYNTKAATTGLSETAAVSLGAYAFLGPLLFWLGAALLFLRIANWLLTRSPGRWRGGLRGMVRRSLQHRSGAASGAALLLAGAVSFGVASSVFGATYDASRRSDARYLIGSDLRVTPAVTNPQPATFAEALTVPGVRAVAPIFVRNDVLVGSQTQTVYGVDVNALTAATTIEDRFFAGGGAKAVLERLRTTPDGLLVSNELAASYNIQEGDTVAMRIPTVSGSLTDVKLKVLGIFTLFPTSSQNSDLVVNSAFLVQATKIPSAGFFLLRTDGTAASNEAVATTLAQRFKDRLALRIETADRAVSQDQSSLVGVNLAGLAALDRLYSALIVALALGVFLLGSIIERRGELGTLEALGATSGQVARLLLTEGVMLAAGGVVGGLIIGMLLAWQYTGFLPGIFSVPLPVLSIPLSDLGLLLGLAFVGAALAAVAAALHLRQLWPAEILREM